MFDIGWSELIVIGAVALVAIGPKDMPKVMYTMGKWAGKARRAATEFNRVLEQAAYEGEIAEKLKRTAGTEPLTPAAPTAEPSSSQSSSLQSAASTDAAPAKTEIKNDDARA